MVGDEAGGHIEELTQFAIAVHAFHQQVQDQQPLRLGQDLQPLGQSLHVGGLN